MSKYRIIVIGNMWRDLDVVELPFESSQSDYVTKRRVSNNPQDLYSQKERLIYPEPCHALSNMNRKRSD